MGSRGMILAGFALWGVILGFVGIVGMATIGKAVKWPTHQVQVGDYPTQTRRP